VWLLERTAGPLDVSPLRGAAAIAELLANAFVELPAPQVWQQALRTCRALAARRIVHRARIPEGVRKLRDELRRWPSTEA
jgi:hypothetical protein